MEYEFIQKNINKVNENIDNALKRRKETSNNVQLIAVSKTKPWEMLQAAYDSGCRLFGENKVQEIMDKYDKLPNDIKWHMIGHLQTNKVKYIIDKVACIHSVDSVRLAEAISKEAIKKNIVIDVLIEINIADEESKFGIKPENAIEFIREISVLPGIHINGLMTVAPYVEDSEENRPYFVKMRELSVDISKENIDNVDMSELSMGMSGDYEVAIEEGATFVRVGTSIFGERNYSH